MGEFVAPHAEALAWISGFTGSAGAAVILKDRAVILTDSRYTIQVKDQVDDAIFTTADSGIMPIEKWIAENAPAGSVIGYDPRLHTVQQVEKITTVLSEKSIQFRPLQDNPVNSLWIDRPAFPAHEAYLMPDDVSGLDFKSKIRCIKLILKEKNISSFIFNLPDSIAWLLNVRGGDIETTPVVLSLGILHADDRPFEWIVDPGKISQDICKVLVPDVEIKPFSEIEPAICAAVRAGMRVGMDFQRTPIWFKQQIEAAGGQAVDCKDPCIHPKAVKNKSEQAAIRAAHLADGAAMVRFLHWFSAHGVGESEMSIAEKLESFRRMDKNYKGPSFDTIAGFGPNGAIVHYRASPQTNRPIEAGNFLLLDSGGQYHYGTTDITRTIATGGGISDDMKRHYTLVLKGHIAVAAARFPAGTAGVEIDALARAPLKAQGLDYGHGTGHGVGCFLSVHEEAASLSPRGKDAIEAGMLISNEPGFYRAGQYGIRIENLVLAVQAGEGVIGFETVTLAPIDLRPVLREMLAPPEIEWFNAYHRLVFDSLAPLVSREPEVLGWLAAATQPV